MNNLYEKIFVGLVVICVISVAAVQLLFDSTNNGQSDFYQEQAKTASSYAMGIPLPTSNSAYQEYKERYKRDKGLLSLLDLYNTYFIPDSRSVLRCAASRNYEREKCYRDLNIFCSERLWNNYGIYTNVKPEDRDCFCEYNNVYKGDKCILTRRNSMDKDIGFFDYKFFLPDDLKMSKDKFKQVADKYRVVKLLQQIKCLDNDLELLSTERDACERHMYVYIKNLSYNKIPVCNKKYNMGRCSDEQLYHVREARHFFDKTDKELCEQLKRTQFEIDNNCILKE